MMQRNSCGENKRSMDYDVSTGTILDDLDCVFDASKMQSMLLLLIKTRHYIIALRCAMHGLHSLLKKRIEQIVSCFRLFVRYMISLHEFDETKHSPWRH